MSGASAVVATPGTKWSIDLASTVLRTDCRYRLMLDIPPRDVSKTAVGYSRPVSRALPTGLAEHTRGSRGNLNTTRSYTAVQIRQQLRELSVW